MLCRVVALSGTSRAGCLSLSRTCRRRRGWEKAFSASCSLPDRETARHRVAFLPIVSVLGPYR